VKQSDLGEYEENAREKPKYIIYRVEHQLPLKPSHMKGKLQFPTVNQHIEKNQGVW
jgi:hypothetical protein